MCLNQMLDILGDEDMENEEFCHIFDTGLDTGGGSDPAYELLPDFKRYEEDEEGHYNDLTRKRRTKTKTRCA